MKRTGYIYEDIINVDNCKKAIINASKSKNKKGYVVKILNNIDYYANDLSKRLQTKRFTTPYRVKKIIDGCSKKERIIHIPKYYPDQCAHHAIVQVLKPFILKSSYYWSCANIEGRGLSRAQRGMRRMTQQNEIKYCAKLDIRKFYPSLKNDKLKKFLRTKIKDIKALEIIDTIIDTAEGLPIGNYTSPWLAEWYLQSLDHYIKEELKVKDNYQLFRVKNGKNGRKIDFVGQCYAINYSTLRKRRALVIMKQSRLIDRLKRKNKKLNYHLCASYISHNSGYLYSNTYHMKMKYQKHYNCIKKVISERSKENVEKSRS